MWTYYLVEELIMNNEWIEKNGSNWKAGRVECWESRESELGYSSREYGLIIDGKNWNEFDDYLRSISTDTLKTLDELIEMSKLPIVQFKSYEKR